MNRVRAFSSPEIEFPASSSTATNAEAKPNEDGGLEGVSANVRLLLKLVQDHNEASMRQQDNWKSQRVASMMMVVEDLKSRIQKAQISSGKKELRRSLTDLKPSNQFKTPTKPPTGSPGVSAAVPDELQRLKRELSESLAARRSLQMMCSSMGKEKEIMAKELARKAEELTGMEELINDLRIQNDRLSQKVQSYAAEHKDKKGDHYEPTGVVLQVQEQNKELSDHLLKSIDGYRSLKRKYKEIKEENSAMRQMLRDLSEDVKSGSNLLQDLQQKLSNTNEDTAVNLEDEVSSLESLFQELDAIISYSEKK